MCLTSQNDNNIDFKVAVLTDAEVLRALLEERVDDLLRLRLLHGKGRRGDLLADDLLLLNGLHEWRAGSITKQY